MPKQAYYLLIFTGLMTTPVTARPQDDFFESLKKHCGKSYEGQVVKHNKSDESWLKEKKVIHIRDCSDTEIRIPLHVGENRSRTWIITRTDKGLRLKHDHRHQDGKHEAVTMYGGDTKDQGTATSQSFPADEETKSLFLKNDLKVAVENVWKLEIEPAKRLSYALNREARDFRIDFDLTKEVATPPPVWGHKK
ncbi:MAG TPA: hypothetical protein VE954_24550 [Oligoflexus sp.]|uniref:hypothetical protein n=1 Tax=Oligoflexus sp. TaxID=1971216 RepID=UPI002D27542F|nr:hypothetical protein [Oligoflexus sp.]HYX36287.1 hypothetical protein [Oligoflexus sp.]